MFGMAIDSKLRGCDLVPRSARIDDPLVALFERTSNEARKLGLSHEEIEAELDAYNAERRI